MNLGNPTSFRLGAATRALLGTRAAIDRTTRSELVRVSSTKGSPPEHGSHHRHHRHGSRAEPPGDGIWWWSNSTCPPTVTRAGQRIGSPSATAPR
jgi:hypothetical protein